MKKLIWLTLIALLITMSGSVLAYDFGDVDLGGETVTFVWWANHFPEDNLEIQERKAMAEEKFNCKIDMKVFGWGEYTEGLTTRLISGDSEYDIWTVFSDHFWPLVGQDNFYPISEELPVEYYTQFKSDASVTTFEGARYGFSDPYPGTGVYYLYFNKEIFEELDLPNPYELYEEGIDSWNWDAVTEIAKKATRDIDSDGELDQWGLGNIFDAWAQVGFTNNAYPFVTNEDNKVVFNYDNVNALESLRQIHQWFSVDKVALDWSKNQWKDGNVAMHMDLLNKAPKFKESANFEYGIVPLPAGPRADRFVTPARGHVSWVLPANSSNPTGLVALYKYLFDYRPAEEAEEQLMEDLMSWVNDKESYEIVMDTIDDWNGESTQFRYFIRSEPAMHTVVWDVGYGGKTPAQAMEEIKPKIQAQVDEVLEQ